MSQKSKRQHWMSVLANADTSELIQFWDNLPEKRQYNLLRKPETGLVMIRGRIGGTGAPFNTGEATVTRCAVTSQNGDTGHAYILGQSHAHAIIAAKADAGLQDESLHDAIMKQVIIPLEQIHSERRAAEQNKVAGTKVDFFTMVRGED